MRVYYDCEFLEGKQEKKFLGIKIGYTKPTIDLISIGMVNEEGDEYYVISKDFNLKEAWNRYDIKYHSGDVRNMFPNGYKVYWIRENVLKPIWKELVEKEFKVDLLAYYEYPFSYSGLKYLIKKYGKSNKQIAEEIKDFVYKPYMNSHQMLFSNDWYPKDIKFYGYFSGYDHVVLCWLFGKMIDLPSGFPMFTIDLKQEFDNFVKEEQHLREINGSYKTFEELSKEIKGFKKYPKQTNEHISLQDAK